MKAIAMILPAAMLAVGLAVSTAAAQTEYKLVKTIDLPGDKGGHGDWTTFDRDTHTVWLSQSPDHDVVVIDAATNKVKGVIPGVENGQGIALTPEYAFLSDAKGNATIVVNKRTLQKVATLKPEGKGPNGTNYVPQTGEVYVSTDNNEMTVFSAKPPFKETAHFTLEPNPAKGGPDVGLYVAAKRRLYQPDDNIVDVIDPGKHAIVATWNPGVTGDTKPMVYDAKTNHIVLGTTDLKVLVLDAKTGKAIASIPVKGKVDETVIDEGARRAFVGDKAGLIEVVDLDRNTLADILPSEKNVHTLTVDPATHVVYVYRNESNKVDVFARR
ncbi:MAG TPA: hypothetical protein VGR52_00515 [Stellaceae bacterium]|nr:hypothetical protein [Stellaceae bacterium]